MVIFIPGILYFIWVNIDSSQILYYLINGYKLNRRIILKLNLKVLLGVPYSSTKDIEHFSFFKKEIVIVNTELSLYLNPLILKNRVYPVRQ